MTLHTYKPLRARRPWPKKPKRARMLWRSGRVILDAEGIAQLRQEVFNRAGGKCEAIWAGERCNRYAPWDGFKRGNLHHNRRAIERTDTAEACIWACRDCHQTLTGKLAWSNRKGA